MIRFIAWLAALSLAAPALAAVGRVYVGPASGYLVEAVGWVSFFGFTFVIALPGLLLLVAMRRHIGQLDHA